jgi:hypothetical protein
MHAKYVLLFMFHWWRQLWWQMREGGGDASWSILWQTTSSSSVAITVQRQFSEVSCLHQHNPSGRTMALGSTQPLIEMSILFCVWYGSPPPQWGQGLFIHMASRTQNNAAQSVGLLWTSDQLVAQICTWQHTTLTADKQPCHWRTEMSTVNIFWGVKAAGTYSWQTYQIHVSSVIKSGALSLLEASGNIQARNGIVLPSICLRHCNLTQQTRMRFNKRIWQGLIRCVVILFYILYSLNSFNTDLNEVSGLCFFKEIYLQCLQG